MRKILLFVVISTCCATGHANNETRQLSKALEAVRAEAKIPGFAVAIVSANSTVYKQAFGFADIQNRRPYTTKTVQNIASVSKTMIGVALVKAVELGYFTLDTEVDSVLPFKAANPHPEVPITIRHLVTHTAGLVDDEDGYGKSNYLTPFSEKSAPLYDVFARNYTEPGRTDLTLGGFLKNYLSSSGQYFKPTNYSGAVPGQAYRYSNVGAALTAYLIEVKSGQSFAEFTQRHIFTPLAMAHTSWQMTPALARLRAQDYNRRGQAYPHYGLVTYPDGGLITSVDDLTKFMRAMLAGYGGEDGILSSVGFRMLFQKQFSDDALPLGSPKGEPNSGILWRIKPSGLIGHTGSDPGVTTFMFFNPQTHLAKILLLNTEAGGAGQDDDPKVMGQILKVWKLLDAATPK